LALGSIGVAAEILDDVPGWLQAAPVGLPLILFPLAVSAFYWTKAHTVAGRQITDQIEGFRQYLGVAEEARLDALNPPDKTPELFERFLPYAIALDVENHWAQRFAGVLAAAAAAGATATWYSGSHDWGHDPVGFANNLGGDLSSTIASASEAPGRAADRAAVVSLAEEGAAAVAAGGSCSCDSQFQSQSWPGLSRPSTSLFVPRM
jgi:hypothetical protein